MSFTADLLRRGKGCDPIVWYGLRGRGWVGVLRGGGECLYGVPRSHGLDACVCPLRANLMSAYSLGKFNCLSELQLHVAISNLCRLPATSRVNTHRLLQPTGPKICGSSKGSWKRQNKHLEGGRSQSFDKSIRPSGGASGSEGHGHGNSSLGQKNKLPLHEQKKTTLGLRLSTNCLKQNFSK